MPDSQRNDSLESNLSNVLGKYIEVWLYSIQFGVLSGVTFSFFSFRSDPERWGVFGLPIALLAIAGAIPVLLAWSSLARYLRGVLIPKFILNAEPGMPREEAARVLRSSMSYLILALAFRVSAVIFDLVFQLLRFL